MDRYRLAEIMDYSKCWEPGSQERAASERLLSHLLTQPLFNLNHISFTVLRRVMGEELQDADIFTLALNIASRSSLLELKYELIDDEESVDVDILDVIDARKTGVLHHPNTGKVVDDYASKLFVYFKGTQKLTLFREIEEGDL